jgi:hypothetical protein
VSERSVSILIVFMAFTFAGLSLWLLHGLVEAMRASGGYQ